MPQVLDEAPRVTRDEGRAEAEVPEAEEEAGRAVLLPAACWDARVRWARLLLTRCAVSVRW